jgi:ribose transport system permease protein
MIFGVLAGLGAGVAIGAFNGVLVAYLRLPSFLVTLATMGLFAGIARSMTDLRSIPVINDSFTGFFGSGKIFSVPSLVLWTIAAVVIGHVVYRNTRFGAHVVAVGDNANAAQVSGIKVPRVRLYVLMLCGATAGLAGLLYAGRLQAAKYTFGESDLMTVIAAVIVGGTALKGGQGRILGTVVGAILLSVIGNILNLTSIISVYLNAAVQGFVIIVVAFLQRGRR